MDLDQYITRIMEYYDSRYSKLKDSVSHRIYSDEQIIEAYEACGTNRNRASREFGINPSTYYARIVSMGLHSIKMTEYDKKKTIKRVIFSSMLGKKNLEHDIEGCVEFLDKEPLVCHYTGCPITLPIYLSKFTLSSGTAAIDRKYSHIGYVPDNVVFALKPVNMLKGSMPYDIFIKQSLLIADRHRGEYASL